MIHFRFFKKLTLTVHPFFWLMAALIGWLQSGTFSGTLIWMVVIFFSVLVHELGHGSMAILFGQKAHIEFVFFGGETTFVGKKLRPFQHFLVVFSGPFSGFLLFLLSSVLLSFFPSSPSFLRYMQVANLFWAIVNLLPVLPLDGGHLLRIICEAIFGFKGITLSLWIGVVIGLGISFLSFATQNFLLGAFFFLLAFQSLDSARKMKGVAPSDQAEENTRLFSEGEKAVQEGRKEEAKKLFCELREKAKKGLLFVRATITLAQIEESEGHTVEAYQLLLPLRKELPPEGICFLQTLAMKEREYSVVVELSGFCYEYQPTVEVAVMNARAFAFLKQPEAAGGWLQAAFQKGIVPMKEVLEEEEFRDILSDPLFQKFIPPSLRT